MLHIKDCHKLKLHKKFFCFAFYFLGNKKKGGEAAKVKGKAKSKAKQKKMFNI